MTETLNEIWTNAENLAKLVANAYVANAENHQFKTNKAYFMKRLDDLVSARSKSIFIGELTSIVELIEDKKEISKIVKYIHNLPVEEVKAGQFREYPEKSFGYFRVTFNFNLKCEEVEKRIKENVG